MNTLKEKLTKLQKEAGPFAIVGEKRLDYLEKREAYDELIDQLQIDYISLADLNTYVPTAKTVYYQLLQKSAPLIGGDVLISKVEYVEAEVKTLGESMHGGFVIGGVELYGVSFYDKDETERWLDIDDYGVTWAIRLCS
jgi:hypothetical protein